MPITQHRPVAALAGRRFGSFASKTEGPTSSHPVGKIIQAYSYGVTSGRRYGSFAGKAEPGPGGGWELEAPLTAEFAATFDASGSIALRTNYAGAVALSAAFGATGSVAVVSGPTIPTVTLRILDKAEAGLGLAASSGWDFFWYDDATTMAEAVADVPTVSLMAQSIGADGAKVLTLTGSAKTSGQSGFLMFSNGARSFAALVEVD